MWQNNRPVKQVSQMINVKKIHSCTLKLLCVSFSAKSQQAENHLLCENDVQTTVNPTVSDKLR